jgi:hypothetical protein
MDWPGDRNKYRMNKSPDNPVLVDFRTTPYFGGHIQFLGIVLALAGVVVIVKSIIASIILLAASLVILTTRYGLTINFKKRSYFDYLWILGLKKGDWGKFENLEYLFVKEIKVSQTMNLQSLTSTIRKEMYDGYLRFSEHDKIHLMTKDSKEALISKLRPIAKELNVRIIDLSVQPPKEV